MFIKETKFSTIEVDDSLNVKVKTKRDYDDFSSFFIETKDDIFGTILSSYEVMRRIKKVDEILVVVYGKIEGVAFDTEFLISKENVNMLIKDILPYYESIEKYEFCSLIKKIVSEFNGETTKKS
jgi:hypothetical protein